MADFRNFKCKTAERTEHYSRETKDDVSPESFIAASRKLLP
jgi:hypothetical protein